MGITRIANITGLDNIGLPVYACMRPNSRSLSVSQGKGIDSDSAKASAFMESVEHWHGERVELAGRNESYSSLRQENEGGVVDILALPVARGARPQAHLPLWWNSGWDILTNRPIWVPFETVSTNFVSGIGRSTFFASSNGLASGNHLLEAVLHGLLEVIERDSHARWSSKSDEEVRATSIDLATVDDPVCLGVLELLDRAKVHARVFDMTCDLGIPAYFCMLHERHDQWRPLGAASGLGCSLSPEVALLRALTEAVQSRTTMIAGSRDDMFYRAYSEFVSVRGSKAIDDVAEQTPGRLSFSVRKSLATTTFEGDIAILCNALRCRGEGRRSWTIAECIGATNGMQKSVHKQETGYIEKREEGDALDKTCDDHRHVDGRTPDETHDDHRHVDRNARALGHRFSWMCHAGVRAVRM